MGYLSGSGRRAAALVVTSLVLAALGASAPSAGALSARFAVVDHHGYSRILRVSVTDEGRTPFFTPAVVVWDGGSIIAGRGADAEHRFPAMTLTMVPKTCSSYVSVTGGAKIADMLAEAPVEVDARYAATADLNLCLAQPGGSDLRGGLTAADVFVSLQEYCRARRAAGFRVLVVTLLPSHRTETFEVLRLAYNAMVRDGWPGFADGLVDIAADPRIGDDGDEYDEQFYLTDQLHPNNAGNAVMAAVAAPVLCAQPWLSDRCELRVRDAAGDWGPWRPWSPRSSLWLDAYEGVHLVEAEYRLDGGEPVTVSDSVFVDTVSPCPLVRRDAVVRRGMNAVLRYRIDDAEPCGPTATVVITLKTATGRVVKRLVRHNVRVNARVSATFRCSLSRGSYRWVVTARDTAGNRQVLPATGRLRVR
jgi:hypothetical protein